VGEGGSRLRSADHRHHETQRGAGVRRHPGGKDNFAVDREVARQATAAMGDDGNGARMNRAALGRAVRFMAREG
jgi:hypothetical protein